MTPGLLGRYRLRVLLAGGDGSAGGDGEHWDAVHVDSGQRCVVAVSSGESVTARELSWTLDEVADGGDDVVLAALVAVALAGLPPGRGPGAGATRSPAPLPSRLVATAGVIILVGPPPTPAEARAAYLLAAPSDALQLADLVGQPATAPLLVRAMATFLAAERHLLVRRAGLVVHDHRLQRLRGAAARLSRFPPPRQDEGLLLSDGSVVTAGALLFDGQALDARATRAALRATAGHESPLRRWLAAMCRLRVDREILARR